MEEESVVKKEKAWKRLWKSIHEKQPHLYIMVYFAFVFWNFIICLLPIIATHFVSRDKTIVMSSFLAYCFTTLAITLFAFMHREKQPIGGIIIKDTGFIISAGFMAIYMFVFFLFNYDNDINLFIIQNIVTANIVAFIPVFTITLCITIPVINSYVLNNNPKRLKSKIDSSDKNADEIINNINTGGIQ